MIKGDYDQALLYYLRVVKGRRVFMEPFGGSPWADEAFAKNYLDKAEIYIVERRTMISLMTSLYAHAFSANKGMRLLDLGCGDGILTRELYKVDASLRATLVDGSLPMLEKARTNLRGHEGVQFINISFQELLHGTVALEPFDFVVSSMAIHHLKADEKVALFRYIYEHLHDGGHFVNIEVVLPPSEELEAWYFHLWSVWMQQRMDQFSVTGETPEEVIERYKSPSSTNNPDTLEFQLGALRTAGFRDVECYFKFGIFVVFGGKK